MKTSAWRRELAVCVAQCAIREGKVKECVGVVEVKVVAQEEVTDESEEGQTEGAKGRRRGRGKPKRWKKGIHRRQDPRGVEREIHGITALRCR